MRFHLSLILLAGCLIGCTSLGPRFSEQPISDGGKAQIYIYRVSKFAGAAGSPYVCLDGKVIGELANGGYFSIEVAPGAHVISKKTLGEDAGNFGFTVSPGKSYFVRSDFSVDNGARESAEIGRNAALGPGGGGALGEVMSSAFFGSENDKKLILEMLDTRAQKASVNPGFLMVKPDYALGEIRETKLFTVPDYKKNFCGPRPKAEQNGPWH